MRVLICGLPGSGKTTISEELLKYYEHYVHLNADTVRKNYDDWDFTPEGRFRQAQRMRYLADGVVAAGGIPLADFVAPTEEFRKVYDPDYTIFVDTIDAGRFEDTNAMFERPTNPDYHIEKWFDNEELVRFGARLDALILAKLISIKKIEGGIGDV